MLIGSTMLVPGVSGGSMAMILGIYEKLIEAVSSFFKNIRDNLVFLLLFAISVLVGMLLLARPILSLLETYPKAMGFFFIGAVAGGIPVIYQQAQIKEFSIKYIIYFVIGLLVVMLLSLFPSDGFVETMGTESRSVIFLVLAGIVAAAALILPGISVSYLLLILGLYHELMRAISEFDMFFFLPMGVGVICGIILLTRGLEYMMDKYPQMSYLIILGFVVGSLAEVFPGTPEGTEWIQCFVTGGSGFCFIFSLSRMADKS